MIGGSIPGLFTGAVITENIFAIDGLGSTGLLAMRQGDIPFIMAFNIFIAVMTLLGTLISDILYTVVDPRSSIKLRRCFFMEKTNVEQQKSKKKAIKSHLR